MNRYLVFLFIVVLSSFSNAQNTTSKEYVANVDGIVTVKGVLGEAVKGKSGQVFLYEMLGNDEFLIDSAKITGNSFIFSPRKFMTGLYKLGYNNVNNALDFVINPGELDGEIEILINNYRINNGYAIDNSLENKVKQIYDKQEQAITSKIKLIRKSQKTRDQKLREITLLQDELFQFGLSLNTQYPGTYFGMILSHMQSSNKNTSHMYFNDIDFSDESIIRSKLLPTRIQIFIQRFNNYATNEYGFHDAVDIIMSYALKNDKVAEFCMYNMLDGFYNTGQSQTKDDPIWINLCNYIIDEYILGEGCGDELEPSDLLKERASQYKQLQVGNIPPNFSVSDVNNQNIDLYKVCKKNKYTVLMFWASHCQHCMAELPGFANWYNQNTNKEFEIIAISLDAQKSKWEKTVRDKNFNWVNICQFKVYKSPICLDYKIKKTPTIFVLNNKMEIVYKPKSTNQLRSFLLSSK